MHEESLKRCWSEPVFYTSCNSSGLSTFKCRPTNHLLVWNWAPLGKMINFGSLAQRNALDQWSNNPSLDYADQWCGESLSRVNLIDHWSENGFARKEHRRSEILIWIFPKERTLNLFCSQKKKTSDNRMCTHSPSGHALSSGSDASIQPKH